MTSLSPSDEPLRAQIASRLRQLRARAKPRLTQADVAKAIESSAASIGSWESGRNPPPADMLAALALFYRVSSDYIVGITDTEYSLPRGGLWVVDRDAVVRIAAARRLAEVEDLFDDRGGIAIAFEIPYNPAVLPAAEAHRLNKRTLHLLSRLK